MAQIENFISFSSTRFADDYDVYVDYGKGRPIQIQENEKTFIDVENFLTEHHNQSKKFPKKNINEWKINDNKQNRKIENKRCISTSEYSSHRKNSSINNDQIWFSNKQHNSRVNTLHHSIRSKIPQKLQTMSIEDFNFDTKLSRRKLHLNIAVNGISKSMHNHISILNRNLKTGDFGDDAGLFTENKYFSLVGLADGASGNHLLGINPADFPRAILSACEKIFHQNQISSNQLSQLILSAIKLVQNHQIRGSSTLCLLTLDKFQHYLTTLNIGDSGFVIYRNKQLYYRSTCTIQSNNYGPKQLFAFENSLNLPCFIDEKEILQDCSLDRISVEKNDLIILSSDGLWNVIKSKQIKQLIENNQNQNIQNLANDLLDQAVNGYVMNNRDDILIIVCRVEES